MLRAPITSHKRCTRKKLAVKDFLRKCDQTTVFCGLTLTEEIVNEKLKVLCCEDLCDWMKLTFIFESKQVWFETENVQIWCSHTVCNTHLYGYTLSFIFMKYCVYNIHITYNISKIDPLYKCKWSMKHETQMFKFPKRW